jgi:hypothetical protein
MAKRRKLLQLCRAIDLVSFALVLIHGRASAQPPFLANPTPTFNPTTNNLTGYTVTVTGDARFPVGPGTAVTLQYQTKAGTPIGAPVTATVGEGNILTVPRHRSRRELHQ